MKHPESELQKQCVKWLEFQYPGKLFTHPANEGKKSIKTAMLHKALGMKPGVPDLLIFDPNEYYIGLAIEFKSGKGKLTENQISWKNDLIHLGWIFFVVNNFELFQDFINNYFRNGAQNGNKKVQ